MNRRPRLPPTVQILVAGAAGALLGRALGMLDPNPWPPLVIQLGHMAASLYLAWTRALAVPLVVSSLVLGAVGLEAMRSMGRVTRRTIAWMALSGLLAVLTGVFAASVLPPATSGWITYTPRSQNIALMRDPTLSLGLADVPPWGWVGLVLVGLGFAYYRNQIDEGHARVVTRLFQAIEEMLAPMLAWTVRLAPWGVFALLLVVTSQPDTSNDLLEVERLRYFAASLLLASALFVVGFLPLALWGFARVNPWKYLTKLLPAALTAFASGSLEANLPLTWQVVRREAHVSNRVAGLVLSWCAAFQREGLALGYVAVFVCSVRTSSVTPDWHFYMQTILIGWLLAVGGAVLRTGEGPVITYLLLITQFRVEGVALGWMLERFVTMGGAAISVLSHGCAAAIIAKGEGEFWVPGPPPGSDELQGLIADRASAED